MRLIGYRSGTNRVSRSGFPTWPRSGRVFHPRSGPNRDSRSGPDLDRSGPDRGQTEISARVKEKAFQ